MAKKPRTIKSLKSELWTLFSKYIKLLHSKDGVTCLCFTCHRVLTIGTKTCQGGHWLPKDTYGVHWFEEDNVRPQCGPCNKWRLGDAEAFRRNLQVELGEGRIDELFESRMEGGSFSVEWYLEKIKEYKLKLSRIEPEDY